MAAQRVPGVLSPASPQTGVPDAHEIVPFLQSLFGLSVHDMPAVQSTHAPALLQTLLTPQLAPGSFCMSLLQTIDPVLQLVTPVKHLFGLSVQA